MKHCSNINCTEINPQELTNFPKNKKGKNGLYCHCKKCHNKESRKRYNTEHGWILHCSSRLKNRFWPHLTPLQAWEVYQSMLKTQNYVCAICLNPETEVDYKYNRLKLLTVDHNHKTGKVRKLLCNSCNRGLGQLKDSSTLCYKAYEYLINHDE